MVSTTGHVFLRQIHGRNSVYEANADRMVRERCIARKLAERRERTLERDINTLKDENAGLKERNSSLEERIKELEMKLDQKV